MKIKKQRMDLMCGGHQPEALLPPARAVLGQTAAERTLRTGKGKAGYAVLTMDRLWFCRNYLQGNGKKLTRKKDVGSLPTGEITQVTRGTYHSKKLLALALVLLGLSVAGFAATWVLLYGLAGNWQAGATENAVLFGHVGVAVCMTLTLFAFLWYAVTGGKAVFFQGADCRYGLLLRGISQKEEEQFRACLEGTAPREVTSCSQLGKDRNYVTLEADGLCCFGKPKQASQKVGLEQILGLSVTTLRPRWAEVVGKVLGFLAIGTAAFVVFWNMIWYGQLGLATIGKPGLYESLVGKNWVHDLPLSNYGVVLVLLLLWAYWATWRALIWSAKLVIHCDDRILVLPADKFTDEEVAAFRQNVDVLQPKDACRHTPEFTARLLHK